MLEFYEFLFNEIAPVAVGFFLLLVGAYVGEIVAALRDLNAYYDSDLGGYYDE